MQRDSDIVDSGNPRLVLYCVKRSMSKSVIGVARGGAKRVMPPNFWKNMVILYFERLFSQQNNVIRLKSNILAPPNFWAGYATEICSSGSTSLKTPLSM